LKKVAFAEIRNYGVRNIGSGINTGCTSSNTRDRTHRSTGLYYFIPVSICSCLRYSCLVFTAMANAYITLNPAALRELSFLTVIQPNSNHSAYDGRSRKMRRKPIIENPRELAEVFANAVTEFSSNQMDWVARNGSESLFATLERIIPEVRDVRRCSVIFYMQTILR
jgi:hypothetical protein